MNWKRFAIKFADLKDQATYNQINKVFGYLVDFPMKSYSNPGFTSTKAELIYQWTLTISEEDISEKTKISILSDAIDDLLSNEDDKVAMKNIIAKPQEEKEVIIKEVIKYIEKDASISDVSVQIDEYLPITFFDPKNDEFRERTVQAYQSNYTIWNYQFAYIAYYMLFVSYLYKVIWELRSIWASNIISDIEVFVQSKLKCDLNIIFDLSSIGEDEFCRKINDFIRCLHKNEIDEIANFVQKRNHCAHPSGMIQYSKSEVDNLIQKIDIYTKKIQDKIDWCLLAYVKTNLDWFWADSRFMLSRHELIYLYEKFGDILDFLSDTKENIEKKIRLVQVLISNAQEAVFPDDIFYHSVKIFLHGYSPSCGYSVYDIIQSLGTIDSTNTKLIIDYMSVITIDEEDKSEVLEFLRNS